MKERLLKRRMAWVALAFDGGGIRGYASLEALIRVRKIWAPAQQPTLLSGVSTGAIIAAGLAAGFTPQQIMNLYETIGSKLFVDMDAWFGLSKRVGDLKHKLKAKYDVTELEAALQETFGDIKMGDLFPRVTFPVTTYMKGRTVSFEMIDSTDPDHVDSLVWRKLVDACTAPTYFTTRPYHDLDGGLTNNSGTAWALMAILKSDGSDGLKDWYLIDFGTGRTPITGEKDPERLTLSWLTELVPITIDAGLEYVHRLAKLLMRKAYYRIDLGKLTAELDDLNAAKQLAQSGEMRDAIRDFEDWKKVYG